MTESTCFRCHIRKGRPLRITVSQELIKVANQACRRRGLYRKMPVWRVPRNAKSNGQLVCTHERSTHSKSSTRKPLFEAISGPVLAPSRGVLPGRSPDVRISPLKSARIGAREIALKTGSQNGVPKRVKKGSLLGSRKGSKRVVFGHFWRKTVPNVGQNAQFPYGLRNDRHRSCFEQS